MEEEADIAKKLYFFSVTYGECSRLLNQAWDDDVSLVHAVCQSAHQQIDARLMMVATGQDRVMGIPKESGELLTLVVVSLAKLFAKPEMDRAQLAATLAKVANLAYASTGNGGYLHMKGHLKL